MIITNSRVPLVPGLLIAISAAACGFGVSWLIDGTKSTSSTLSRGLLLSLLLMALLTAIAWPGITVHVSSKNVTIKGFWVGQRTVPIDDIAKAEEAKSLWRHGIGFARRSGSLTGYVSGPGPAVLITLNDQRSVLVSTPEPVRVARAIERQV